MWARVVEVMLGCWLAVSPFIFDHGSMALWTTDLACAGAAVTFACLSFWPPLRHVHLLTCAVAAWLVGFGWVHAADGAPASQNHIVVGLLLAMFAIVPGELVRHR